MSSDHSLLAEVLADIEDVPESLVDDVLVDSFTSWASGRGLDLYPAQEESLLSLVAGNHVVLATPTGSGKSLVAVAAHLAALAHGGRTFYTAPIKALVSEKFFDLCTIFGPEKVGMMTGDAGVNTEAPIICATAEIVANLALREGSSANITQVVMDEFHYYADPNRGWAWQVPLLELSSTQFLLMSATLGDVSRLAEDLETRTGRSVDVVTGAQRPVPLSFDYSRKRLPETIEWIIDRGWAPIYAVHFTQREAVERAEGLVSLNLVSPEAKAEISEELSTFRMTTTFGRALRRMLLSGVGVHHAGMLPKYRRLVERLAQRGLLTIVCGTDTLGVGINVPIRSVLFTELAKFDGQRRRILTAREFHQIGGRAGRAGFDATGHVVVQAPEHEVESFRLAQKRIGEEAGGSGGATGGGAAKGAKKGKGKSKSGGKGPAPGEVSWTEQTFTKLREAEPEPLVSRFRVSNALLLNVITRPEPCFAAMEHLIRSSHDTRRKQNRSIREAIELFRGLEQAGIVERSETPDEYGRRVHLTEGLQSNFALDQPLAPFAVAAMELVANHSPANDGTSREGSGSSEGNESNESSTNGKSAHGEFSEALDILSVIESVLEDPRPVLLAQQSTARAEEMAALKAEGVDYHERRTLVEDITWPQPLGNLLTEAFESYQEGHPWARTEDISPKSVVRDMVERGMTFSDVISTYGLARSEGVVLRYLADAYRTLRNTVPAERHTTVLDDIIEWLGTMIRTVDSSLLDEWEQLGTPEAADKPVSEEAREMAFGGASVPTLTSQTRAFSVMVRNVLFRHVELLARDDMDRITALDEDIAEEFPDWYTEIDTYWDEYDEIGIDAEARGPSYVLLSMEGDDVEPGTWRARQILRDPAGDRGWAIEAIIDLAASDEAGDVRFRSLRLSAG